MLAATTKASSPLLDRLRETFALTSVSLLERPEERSAWTVVVSSGWPPCTAPGRDDSTVTISDGLVLVLRGRPLAASDQRVVSAFGARPGVVLERQRLAGLAAEANRLAEANSVRTALLAAVSHDLRSPLAGIKAAVSSLRQVDVDVVRGGSRLRSSRPSRNRPTGSMPWSATCSTSAGSRPAACNPRSDVVDAQDLVSGALLGISERPRLKVDVSRDLPLITTDAALVERVVANLVENAVRYSSGPWPSLAADRSRPASRSAWSTVVPAFPTRRRVGCSPRSSGSATPLQAMVSASGWPSRAASPRPSVASWPPRTPPVEG